MDSIKRLRFVVPALVVTLVASGVFAVPKVAGATDLLPDLEMGSIFSLVLRTSPQERKRLRFGTVVYNVGDGQMEVRADNREGRVMKSVRQWIYQDGGPGRAISKDVRVFYSGDGHIHFHITRFVVVRLLPLPGTPSGPSYRRLRKIGFCLVDSIRKVSTAPSPNYFGCGNSSSQSVTMGIDVNWGDIYSADTKYQHIDVTNLPAGDYRLCATVNGNHAWTEKGDNFANNQAWMDIHLDAANDDLDVLNTGQGACGIT